MKLFHNIRTIFTISLLGCFLLSCRTEPTLKPAQDLTLNEGFVNPIGFYDATPSFSWKLPQEIQKQTAYHLVVASSPELLSEDPDLWDTGKVSSGQSLYISYEGKPLLSRDKMYWKVRFWNAEDQPSTWSEIAQMELGLLQNEDWQAKWIGLNTRKDSIKGKSNIIIHTPQYLRKEFEVNKQLVSAKLYVTAKGVFKGFINGKAISEDVMSPGWTPYQKRIESLTYDVTDLLKEGDNAIGFQLASGWHFGRLLWNKMIWGQNGSPKVLSQLELLYKDGTKKNIVSDNSWQGTTRGPIRFAEIYDGEIYDANFQMHGWATSDFEAKEWSKVEVAPLENAIAIRPKRHHSVRQKTTLDTKEIITPKDGSGVIFNLQQNMLGVPRLRVPMKKGDTLKVRFSEMLDPDGSFYTDNYRSAESTDYYIAAEDGRIDWHPTFTFHGFQYAELSGFDTSKTPKKEWVTGLVQYSDFDKTGYFSSSHDKLNQLQSNINWGLRGNFFDIPTDCPQRDERLGWTGDAQVISPTSIFNNNVHAFWASWLQTLRESQYVDGGIPFVAPDVLENNKVSSGWGDAAVIIPWDIYTRTADTTVLKENYEMMKKWVSHHQSISENYISQMNSFGDWLQPFQAKESNKRGDTSKKLIGTAFFAHAAHLTSKAAEVLGLKEEKEEYQKLYQTVANAFESEFFDNEGKIKNGKATQTAYLLALHFDLLSDTITKKAEQHLLHKIEEADNHLRTGFLGTPLLPRVLDAMGETDLMYQILLKETYPSWFYSINQGATTMWERWNSYSRLEGYNPESMNSLNHYAYGAVGEWMYERIAGIKPLEPGYKKIRIAPIPGGGLTSAEATYDSPYGEIKSTWKIEGDTFYHDATVPPNTTALLSIISDNVQRVIVNGASLKDFKYGQVIENEDGIITIEVPSGNYSIQTLR
ncbi:family 78 glycoside hydrolase catalytic domain [Croceivirga sp. JEA036]|uniref:family 78 glycoside hydrolase catalytic domain n=1 Tax=Croceivirga sp. JEA036 TaxID=2721162 RepID=UPI00143C102F|nr:family 78 glycoside hydrolase catalytic domain [Croceivirga sp. JEA036]NJB35050.1 family 78 glycoside hydrolase catalytic domain [Croceivirga sp. JEA036]